MKTPERPAEAAARAAAAGGDDEPEAAAGAAAAGGAPNARGGSHMSPQAPLETAQGASTSIEASAPRDGAGTLEDEEAAADSEDTSGGPAACAFL